MTRKSVFLFLLLFISLSTAPSVAQVRYGFTAFPHDYTSESQASIDKLIAPHANLYAQHMDQCLPWASMLYGGAIPNWLSNDLATIRSRVQPGQKLYVATTPTSDDRQTLAHACGDDENTPGSLPKELRKAKLNDPQVIRAYIAYVRYIADTLKPDFMNIGIEMSELALRSPADWPAFDTLFRQTVDALQVSHPHIQVGLELVVQSLLLPRVADLVKPTAEYGAYIGLSFYPYGSSFGEHFGAPALRAPPQQWQLPLRFVRQWTNKPLAIAEAGYTTQDVTLESGFNFPGSISLQTDFLDDLMHVAVHDNYLFVVWFIPADYNKLVDKLKAQGMASDAMSIWTYTGLWDANLKPKPAFELWKRWKNQKALRKEPRRW